MPPARNAFGGPKVASGASVTCLGGTRPPASGWGADASPPTACREIEMTESALAHLLEGVRSALSWAPSWLVGLIVLTGSAVVALLLHLWALRLLTRVAARLGAL